MWLTTMPRGPQESLQFKGNCWDQRLGMTVASLELLCELIWSQLHLQVLRTECWKNLWCHLIYPFSFHFFQHPFLSLLCSVCLRAEHLGHYSIIPAHLQAQGMCCHGLLCITELQQFAMCHER